MQDSLRVLSDAANENEEEKIREDDTDSDSSSEEEVCLSVCVRVMYVCV